MQRISLESNSEQLTGTAQTGINSNHYCYSLEEGEAGESKENVYHILENLEGDDVYEVLDKYEQKEQDEEEENVYHILDGQTVIEEEPEGVAILMSSDVTVEDHKITTLQTNTPADGH